MGEAGVLVPPSISDMSCARAACEKEAFPSEHSPLPCRGDERGALRASPSPVRPHRPTKVLVQAVEQVAFRLVSRQIADQRCFRRVLAKLFQ
jgi:hypothetical protein